MSDTERERDAAAQLYAATGTSVADRIAGIEARASRLLRLLGGRRPRASTARWAMRQLRACAITFREPPPPSLIDLVAIQLGVSARRTDIKNSEKFLEAARYVALHPEATVSQVKRAVGKPDWHRQIAAWMGSEEFKALVRYEAIRARKFG